MIGAVLKISSWCALAAEIAWLVLASSAWRTVLSTLGRDGAALAHLITLGTLALSSGLLVLYERRINTFNEPDRQ